MSVELRVTTRIQGTIGILDVSGDVTDTAHDPLMSAYQDVIHRGAKKILLTFQPKSFINSAGIRVIMAVAFQAEKKKQALRVTGLSPHMIEIFNLVGLTSYLTIHNSEKDSLKGWS